VYEYFGISQCPLVITKLIRDEIVIFFKHGEMTQLPLKAKFLKLASKDFLVIVFF
jgi:hypothetical protein